MKPDLNEHPVPNGYVYLGRGDEIPEPHRSNPPEGMLYFAPHEIWIRRSCDPCTLCPLDYYAAPADSEIALYNQNQEEPQMNTQDAHKQLTKDFIEANPPGTRVRIQRGWSMKEALHFGMPSQGSAPDNGEAKITGLWGSTAVELDNDSVYPWFVLEPLATKPVRVELNDDWYASVAPDGIIVGCQHFPLSVIDELVEAREKVQGES